MTTPRPETRLAVDAQGHLRLESPTGRTLDLVADGDSLHLEVSGWEDIRSLVPGARRARGRMIRVLANILATCGLTLSLESAGKPVGRVGHGVRPSWLARVLGLAPARIPLTAVALLFRR